MIITAIIPVDKRKNKAFLEGDFASVLYRGEVEWHKIEEGGELEEGVYEEILRDILRPRSKKCALHLLKNSGKTEGWMEERLEKTGYSKETVKYAVDLLKEYHFLDDNVHAQSYVRSYVGKKSRYQMVYEMQQKDVNSAYMEEALDQSPVDEEESARQALARRLKGKQEVSYQEKSRLAAFLGRRGYSPEMINRVLREIKATESQDQTLLQLAHIVCLCGKMRGRCLT